MTSSIGSTVYRRWGYSASGERELFWRALGHVPLRMSIWIYVPLTGDDERRLSEAGPVDVLTELVFKSPSERYVTAGIALEYRLVFEREWHLPVNAGPDQLINEMLEFLNEALDIALQQELPPARRELMRTASEAVRELVPQQLTFTPPELRMTQLWDGCS